MYSNYVIYTRTVIENENVCFAYCNTNGLYLMPTMVMYILENNNKELKLTRKMY